MVDPILTLLIFALVLQAPHLSKNVAIKIGRYCLIGALVLFILGTFL